MLDDKQAPSQKTLPDCSNRAIESIHIVERSRIIQSQISRHESHCPHRHTPLLHMHGRHAREFASGRRRPFLLVTMCATNMEVYLHSTSISPPFHSSFPHRPHPSNKHLRYPTPQHETKHYSPISITMGNFSFTSQNISLSGSVLSAQCQDGNGNFENSSLDLNNVLSNNNGSFQIGGSGWFNTASNVGLDGQSLTAVLFNDNGQRIDGQINLNAWVYLACLSYLPTLLPSLIELRKLRKADAAFSLFLDSSRTTMGTCRQIER
jgi:CVNH domain